MSIHPGYSGQAFMPESLPRIGELRALLPPDMHVQVDGGIGADTSARRARRARTCSSPAARSSRAEDLRRVPAASSQALAVSLERGARARRCRGGPAP